jgi:hypothetical protein
MESKWNRISFITHHDTSKAKMPGERGLRLGRWL